MRFYLILFFYVSLFFTSCKDDKKIPADVIPEHDMAELLTDIHIVDGNLYDVLSLPDTLAKHGLGYYKAVFKTHNIDTTAFNRSIKYYAGRPELIAEIYTGVSDRLQRKIDSLQKHKPKVNQDSLKKAQAVHAADSIKKAKEKIKADSISNIKITKLVEAQKRLHARPLNPNKKLVPNQLPMPNRPKILKLDKSHALPLQ